jgi:hypothetical protein
MREVVLQERIQAEEVMDAHNVQTPTERRTWVQCIIVTSNNGAEHVSDE